MQRKGKVCWEIPELKHTSIYVVRQLAYSTELLVCINEAYKQYKQQKQGGGENSSQLNSTLPSSLSVFLSCSQSVLSSTSHSQQLYL